MLFIKKVKNIYENNLYYSNIIIIIIIIIIITKSSNEIRIISNFKNIPFPVFFSQTLQ